METNAGNFMFEKYLEEISNTQDGVFFWKDKDGRYLGHSRPAHKMYSCGNVQRDIVGKTDHDMWPEYANVIRENDLKVMIAGTCIFFEEELKIDDEVRLFMVLKAPYRNENREIIGVIGNILSVSAREVENEKIDRYFLEIADCIPGGFYWKDNDGRYVNCNNEALKTLGYKDKEEMIGKTDYDLWPDQADKLRENDIDVMKNGASFRFEEVVQIDNKARYREVIKSPLRNSNGDIIGIIGSYIDVTSIKETESYMMENGLRSSQIKVQEDFKSFVSQIAHDIRSPLVVLSNIIKSCNNLTEKEYITLRNVTGSIKNIANNLLYYGENEGENARHYVQHILVSLALEFVVNHREYQHKSANVEFCYSYLEKFKFECIEGDPSNFFRMISNAINNAVEAIDVRRGMIDVSFVADDENVRIVVQDNGKGMPKHMIEKILSNKPISSTKEGGRNHGLGIEQMRSALKQLDGKMEIESKEMVGTKVSFVIPKADSPSWMVSAIEVHEDDIVVILDDDHSIYHIWMSRFSEYLSNITIKFFASGVDAIEFLNALENKERLLFLTDYELRYQKMDGGEVIRQTDLFDKSIVVSSIYADNKVQTLAQKHGLKILPKQFIDSIPVVLKKRICNKKHDAQVEVVIVDDCQYFSDSIASMLRDQNLKVSTYQKPNEFLRYFKKYENNARFLIDNEFESDINGLDIAEILHKSGYKNIYLLSGWSFKAWELPPYVEFIQKKDDCIERLIAHIALS